MKRGRKKKAAMAMMAFLILAAGVLLFPVSRKVVKEEEQTLPELVMQWPAADGTPEGLKEVEAALSEITRRKIGMNIRLLPVDASSVPTETSLTISSGEDLDLCVSLYGGLSNLVNAGYLQPLDSLLKERGPKLEEICGVQLTGGYYQGRLYGIPVVYSNGYQRGFVCRSDLLKKYGFEVKKGTYYTMDELEHIFETIKQGEGEEFYILAGSLYVSGNMVFSSEALWDSLGADTGSGVLFLEKDFDTSKIINLYDTPEYEAYANRMYRWAKAGYFAPDAAIYEADGSDLVAQGNYLGLFFEGATELEGKYTAATGYEMTYLPTKEPCMMTSSYQNVIWGIPISSRYPQKAMEFLELLYEDESVANLLQYGIEGKSYVIAKKDEKGTSITLPPGKGIGEIPYYTSFGIYGNRLKTYVWYPSGTGQNQEIKKFSDSIAKKSPALGYVFNSEPVAAQQSAVRVVLSRYQGMINTGMVDPKIELPLFRQELKEAGIQEVIEENQRQYEEWRKSEGK